MGCVSSATWPGGDQSPAAAGLDLTGRSSGSRGPGLPRRGAAYDEVVEGGPVTGTDCPGHGSLHFSILKWLYVAW